MNAPNTSPIAAQTRFIATSEGCFVDTGALFLSADGKTVELIEWTADLAGRAAFAEAQKIASECTLAGGGWHVPTPHELISLVNYEKYGPATDAPGVEGGWYWTNQVDPESPSGNALCVSMRGGNVSWGSQNGSGRVRACRRVRASQYLTLAL